MNDLYSLETFNRIKKASLLYLLFSILFLVIGLTFVGLSALFVKPNNALLIKIIDCIVLSILLCLFIYFLIEKFLPAKNRKRFLYNILIVDRFVGDLKIQSISKPYLIKKNIIAYEIRALDEDGKLVICYLEDLFEPSFNVGDTINATLAASFIVDIKGR